MPAGTCVELLILEVVVTLTVYSSRSSRSEFPGGCHVMVTRSDSLELSNSTESSRGMSGISIKTNCLIFNIIAKDKNKVKIGNVFAASTNYSGMHRALRA